jgi:hypothetical protein
MKDDWEKGCGRLGIAGTGLTLWMMGGIIVVLVGFIIYYLCRYKKVVNLSELLYGDRGLPEFAESGTDFNIEK